VGRIVSAQIMYTHVSKCKTNKIKIKKGISKPPQLKQ
jgi:hypothetical protein